MSRSLRSRAPTLTAAVLTLVALAVGPVRGADFVPHSATYELSLASSDSLSGVRAIKGRIEVRVEASCEGWTVQQFVAFNLLADDDSALEHLARLKAYESRDGREFVFSSQTWENREPVEHMAGQARRGDDGAVTVSYSKPAAKSEPLGPGVLFPTRHMLALIARAIEGERSYSGVVFDGSTEDNPFEVSSYIGRERPGAQTRAKQLGNLAGRRMWPIRLAYFKPGALEPRAEFEMSVELYEHGVAGDMVFDYGDFAMAVALRELSEEPAPRCDPEPAASTFTSESVTAVRAPVRDRDAVHST